MLGTLHWPLKSGKSLCFGLVGITGNNGVYVGVRNADVRVLPADHSNAVFASEGAVLSAEGYGIGSVLGALQSVVTTARAS